MGWARPQKYKTLISLVHSFHFVFVGQFIVYIKNTYYYYYYFIILSEFFVVGLYFLNQFLIIRLYQVESGEYINRWKYVYKPYLESPKLKMSSFSLFSRNCILAVVLGYIWFKLIIADSENKRSSSVWNNPSRRRGWLEEPSVVIMDIRAEWKNHFKN